MLHNSLISRYNRNEPSKPLLQRDRPINSPQKFGATLSVAGALLLSVYALPTAYGSVMAHLAVARFRARSAANRSWDASRIRAYRRALDMTFPAPVGVLRIRKAGIEAPILEGTSDLVLNRGVGHIAGTSLPGQPGNLAIAGHRDGFFRGLKDLSAGDLIELDRPTPTGNQVDRYLVRSIKVVLPADTSVLNQTSATTLTLVTCYPFYFVGSAPRRYIVQATLLSPNEAVTHPGV